MNDPCVLQPLPGEQDRVGLAADAALAPLPGQRVPDRPGEAPCPAADPLQAIGDTHTHTLTLPLTHTHTHTHTYTSLLYTSQSPRDPSVSRLLYSA
mgnify:CR=1 FL=1